MSDDASPTNPLGIDPALDSLTNPERLRALRRYKVIGTPQEDLDRLTRLAGELYDTPIALLTLLGDERQTFLSAQGTDLDGVPARPSVCRATIVSAGPMTVENLAEDERFADNYYVTGDLHLRFYAGAPLTTLDGHRIGTLCVYDVEPRSPDPALMGHLQDLADMAIEALERDQFAIDAPAGLNQTVLDHLPGIFYVVNSDGELERWNARFETISGYDPEALNERPADSFFNGPHNDAVRAAIHKVFETGHATVEADFTTAGGDAVPMILTGVRSRIGGEMKLIGMGIDISERKERERQLQKAKENAEAAHREAETARREAERQRRRAEEASASKSRFLTGVAHDLKSPVSAVMGFAEVLERRLDGEVAEYAASIRRAARRITEMSNSLMELARLGSGGLDLDTEPVDVAPVAEEVVADERSRTDDGSTLDVEIDDPVSVRADEGSLRRVLGNLVENAVAYTDPGDDVYVRAHPRKGAEAEVVRITVADTGPGIDPEFRDQLFEPFARNAANTEGTGLGLAVTRELVEAMDGSIDVESEPGDGTRFHIDLPASSPDAE